MSEKPITQAELVGWFGPTLPVEVVTLLFDAPPDATIGDLRRQVRKLAQAQGARVVLTPRDEEPKDLMFCGSLEQVLAWLLESKIADVPRDRQAIGRWRVRDRSGMIEVQWVDFPIR